MMSLMDRLMQLQIIKIANLNRFMNSYNLKQTDVAVIIAQKPPNVNQMLKGTRAISDKTICRLCDYANIDVAFFFETDRIISPDPDEHHIIQRVRENKTIKLILRDTADLLYHALTAEKGGQR